MNLDAVSVAADLEPQVFGVRVPNGVRHQLLRAAQQNLAGQRIVNLQRRRDADVDTRERNPFRELAQGGRQVEPLLLTQLPHDSSHVPQEKLRHRLRRLDSGTRVAIGQVARDLQVQ